MWADRFEVNEAFRNTQVKSAVTQISSNNLANIKTKIYFLSQYDVLTFRTENNGSRKMSPCYVFLLHSVQQISLTQTRNSAVCSFFSVCLFSLLVCLFSHWLRKHSRRRKLAGKTGRAKNWREGELKISRGLFTFCSGHTESYQEDLPPASSDSAMKSQADICAALRSGRVLNETPCWSQRITAFK